MAPIQQVVATINLVVARKTKSKMHSSCAHMLSSMSSSAFYSKNKAAVASTRMTVSIKAEAMKKNIKFVIERVLVVSLFPMNTISVVQNVIVVRMFVFQ